MELKHTDTGKAALAYFAAVFAAGFALGVIRTLWVVPAIGVRSAELIEMPLMIVVSIIACRSVILLFAVPPFVWPRLKMGLLAVVLLVGAELGLNSLFFGRAASEYLTNRDPVSGTAYFLALGIFAAMPVLLKRRGNHGEVSLIEAFIENPDVSESHETVVSAPADLVLDVAEHFDLQSIPAIKAIFRLRERVFGIQAKPRNGPTGLVAETTALGWGVLADRPGREIIVGAAAQPWVGDVKFRPIPPVEFRRFSEPNFVKIAWTLEVLPLAPAQTLFRTQTRVVATDASARRKFRIYWTFAGFFIVLIRLLGNRAIRREAERRFGDGDASAFTASHPGEGTAGI
jgi:hypothetical protein